MAEEESVDAGFHQITCTPSSDTPFSCTKKGGIDDANLGFIPGEDFSFGKSTPSEKLTSDYFSGSDTPSKLKESTRRLSLQKSFNSYIAYSSDEELEDWWEQPKTDYTYSASLSYRDRVTPDRHILSPNMSRKGLRGPYSITENSPPFSNFEFQTNAADRLHLRSRSIPRSGLGAFSDDSDVDESPITDRTVTKSSQSSKSWSQKSSSKQNRYLLKNNRLEYGLDEDSDAEYEHSHSPKFARPIVRVGAGSFLRSVVPGERNGTSSGQKMMNHINTSISSTSIDTQASSGTVNGNFSQGLYHRRWNECLEDSGSLKGRIVDGCCKTWKKIIYFSSIILVQNIYYMTSVYTYTKDAIAKWVCDYSRSQSRTKAPNSNEFQPWSLLASLSKVTTRKIVKTWELVSTHSRTLLNWYEKKKSHKPFIWGWLPLLLLLLVPILFYQFQEHQEMENEFVVRGKIANSSTPSSAWFNMKLSRLTKGFLSFGALLKQAAYYALESANYLIWVLGQFCYSLYVQVFRLGGNLWFAALKLLDSSTLPKLEEPIDRTTSSVDGQEFSLSGYLWKGYSYLTQVGFYIGEGLFSSAVYSKMMIWTTIKFMGNSVSWVLISLWYMLLHSLLSFWNVLEQLWSVVASRGAMIFEIPYNIFMFIASYNYSSTTASSRHEKIHSERLTITEGSSELTLTEPRIQELISLAFQKHLNDNDLYNNEKLSLIIKKSLELELSKALSDAPTKAEIDLLRNQHEKLFSQFEQLKSKLELLMTQQEKDGSSPELVEGYKDILSEISRKISSLSEQYNVLQNDHNSLKEVVTPCCRNLPLTIEKVKEQVTILLADILQFDLSPGEGRGLEDFVSKIERRMKEYFVTKQEMEKKVQESLDKMGATLKKEFLVNHAAHQETVEQTKEQLMRTVVQLIQKEVSNLERSKVDVAEDRIKEMAENHQTMKKEVEEDTDRKMVELRSSIHLEMVAKINDTLSKVIKSLFLEGGGNEQSLGSDLRAFIVDSVEDRVERENIDAIVSQEVAKAFKESVIDSSKVHYLAKDGSGSNGTTTTLGGLNANDVDRIVKAALLKYDADKTGMVDHALESGGGSIVSTRCTEGFEEHKAELTVFGYSVYRYSTNTPRSIIQPERNPGQCYAFKGSQGYVVIQFAGPVRITAFTLEHIPKSLTPSGSIDSAPKEFSVFGLRAPDEEGFHFGDFSYDDGGEPLQYFPVANFSEDYFKFVELRIMSNYGNMKYTCLYRFRVHGVRQFL